MPETQTAARSALTWFEIPVADFDRARRFYETIFEMALTEYPAGPRRMAMFPYDHAAGVGGCLDEGSESRPSETGTVVYLPAHGRLDRTLELVAQAGGRVVSPKTSLPDVGDVAQIVDSEGNRVGLHAKS